MSRHAPSRSPNVQERPLREVRATFTDTTIRVYQAYSPEIATSAVRAQTFVPPFSRGRMTWIKPSFTWMMYRSGWAEKAGQERILAVDILRSGFESALARASLSHFDRTLHATPDEWGAELKRSPVRIQWDPERTLALQPLHWRAIQIGLEGEAVNAYVDEWIQNIADITDLSRTVRRTLTQEGPEAAAELLSAERPYPLPREIAEHIGASTGTPYP